MPILTEIPPWKPCSSARCWMKLIVLGGLVSGFSFILFEIALSWIFSGRPFVPLRLFAAPILGMAAVAQTYPRINVVPIGLVSLAAMSILCTYMLAALLSQFPKLTTSPPKLVASACVFAYFLWIVDFILVDRAIISHGLIVQLHPALHGFIGHVFCYGMVLGLYVVRNQERYPKVMNVRFRL